MPAPQQDEVFLESQDDLAPKGRSEEQKNDSTMLCSNYYLIKVTLGWEVKEGSQREKCRVEKEWFNRDKRSTYKYLQGNNISKGRELF